MCFTSGTTGLSKGVIYSHRALVLHSFACAMVDSFAISHHDTVLPVAPMFHANAWGLPYTCVMTGARLILPGPNVDAESVLDLIEQERVTIACGVPTVWLGVLSALEKNPGRWKFSLARAHRLRRHRAAGATDARSRQTSAAHHALVGHDGDHAASLPSPARKRTCAIGREDEQYEVRSKQGWPAPFVELRVMHPANRPDDPGKNGGSSARRRNSWRTRSPRPVGGRQLLQRARPSASLDRRRLVQDR